MKKFNKNLLLTLNVLVFSFLCFSVPNITHAATSPSLGSSSTYGIVSDTFTNSLNAGLETAITGDVCYTTPPDTAPISISGATVVPCADARGTDQSSALTDINSQSCTDLGVNVVLAGVYTPGCYSSSGTMDIALSTTVTLNGAGTYIFRSGGALTTGADSIVSLAGGASACDVFWAPTGLASLGANAATSVTPTFIGTIIADALGSTGITLGHFANLTGRLLAFGHTVTTDSNTITVPACAPANPILHVVKHVVTDNGGTATAGNWNLAVTSSNGGTGTGSAAGSEAGTTYTLQAGKAYSVTESGGPSGYLMTGSADCTIADATADTSYTCTITNDDIAPTLVVNKIIVNDNAGTKLLPSDFSLKVDGIGVTHGAVNTTTIGLHTVSETADSSYTATIGGHCAVDGTITLGLGDIKICTITNDDIVVSSGGGGGGRRRVPPLIDVVKIPSPLALPNGPGPVTYTYTLRNIGTTPVENITMVGDTCSPIKLISGDINGDLKLDLNETWVHTCTTTLSSTHTNTVTATGWANGISATDIASATVVVGAVTPPLIHVTKVPSPLFLLNGGGTITYTEKITNPGIVPLTNVHLVDDKCSPVTYISGDTNNDSKLDTTETWTYTCKKILNKTTTNTATAEGVANGITIRDFAIATVVVSVPSLPITGFPSKEKYEFIKNIIQTVGNYFIPD
jgi:uncharacterized repeat protein (TIGR01451 family)